MNDFNVKHRGLINEIHKLILRIFHTYVNHKGCFLTYVFRTVQVLDLLLIKMQRRRERSPATKNCAPQATAVCGCGERQPTQVQWQASAREILLRDRG
ncbi:hypothetical protein TNCT_651241 [Trichonephila clavata]|uniref:Uncharacterized protein n=1 Tax=Trichonephila clavata TaxID=2740835 RepID=A0A8X6HUU8_TRICU|nr:hypothetical protein TNCT_651241 [Trichonephila clavata]